MSNWEIYINWSSSRPFVDGWIPKMAATVPVIGYAVLFNDWAADFVSFEFITDSFESAENSPCEHQNGNETAESQDTDENAWFQTGERLRFLYFGLLALGMSNLLYLVARPEPQRLAKNKYEYGSFGLDKFTWSQFVEIATNKNLNSVLSEAQHKEWDNIRSSMKRSAVSEEPGKPERSWNVYKSTSSDTLREILSTHYSDSDNSRRRWLKFCLILSTLGYVLMLIPSIELLYRILLATF